MLLKYMSISVKLLGSQLKIGYLEILKLAVRNLSFTYPILPTPQGTLFVNHTGDSQDNPSVPSDVLP